MKDQQLMSAMAALAALHKKSEAQTPKSPAKKKRKVSISIAVNTLIKKATVPVPEPEVFEYNWPTCACGMDHPPVPDFIPPDQKKCTFYWQIADVLPFISLHRVLTTELKFKEADSDQSGVIELTELQGLLKNILGATITANMVKSTFNEIDTDGSGSLDFMEVLMVVNKLVQRDEVELPTVIQEQYSKVCSIQ